MKDFSARLLAYIIAFSIVGCSSMQIVAPPVPGASPSPTVSAVPSPASSYPTEGWDDHYTAYIKAHLTDVMINSDPQTVLCPGYDTSHGELARQQWASIWKADSYAECGWDRSQDYTEDFIDDVTGKPTVSSGLFQMSISDDTYDGCQFHTSPETMHDPILNIDCMLRVATRLIRNKEPKTTVMNALTGYWSTMNLNNKNTREGACSMLSKLKALEPSCKVVMPSVCN